jgi:hypothetical protein
MSDLIQSLWVGPRLSALERLSISSFLQNGHRYHLYVYEAVEGVPRGVELQDAAQILPRASIFTYREHATYSGFSNFFRYKLLLERGGWWVDTDLVCLKPFDFSSRFVFSSERGRADALVNVGAIKTPAGSEVMHYAWTACTRMDPAQLKWSQCGPTLAGAAVKACSLQAYVQPPHVFCPIHFSEWERMLDPAETWAFDESTAAIHCWNELWRRSNRSKDSAYPAGCLYEELKRRYLDS